MSGDVHVEFSAEVGELESGFALAKAQTQALQREMASLAREMTRVGAAADEALGQKLNSLGGQLAAAKSHMAELSTEMRTHSVVSNEVAVGVEGLLAKFRQFSEGITGIHESFSSAAEVFAGAFAIHEIADWASELAEAGEHIVRMSAELGVSTDAFQEIAAVAKLTGTDIDQLSRAVERMQLGLAHSAGAASPARTALAALNIEADKFRSLSIDQQLETLADAFSRFADGPTKTAAAMALLGRSGAELIPYLDRGRDGLEELNRAARQTGVIMSDETVKGLAESKEAMNLLGLASQSLAQDIGTTLDGAVSASIGYFTKFVEVIDLAIKHVRDWGAIISAEGAAEGGLSGTIPLPDLTSGVPPEWTSRNVTVNAKPQVPEMQIGRGGGRKPKNTAGGEAREQFTDQIDAAKRAASETEDILNNQVKQHKITWDQWAQQSVAALEIEKAAVQQAANQAIASTALSSEQKQAIMRKEADALTDIAKKERDDQAKAAEESMKAWESMAKSVQGIADSQLKGLLSGTESLSTALKKMAEDAIFKLIELGENLTRDMLLGQSLSTALKRKGWAACSAAWAGFWAGLARALLGVA